MKRILHNRSVRQVQREVDEELTYHLERRVRELEARGYGAAEARQEALRRFGDLEETRRICVAADVRGEGRQRRRERWLDVLGDARIGVRQLRRRPGFALAAILMLGVAIGLTIVMYSIADHVLFRPLPFPNAHSAVTLWQVDATSGQEREVAPGNFLDWRERATLFAAFAMAEPIGRDLVGSGPPESLPGWAVTPGWFEALGIRPLLGRLPAADEYDRDAPVVLLSCALWQRRFGSDPQLVGQTINLDNAPVTVLGVLPAGLQYPADDAEIWLPRTGRPDDREDRRSDYMRVLALPRPGVTLAQAQGQMDEIARWQAAAYPATNADTRVLVRPLPEQVLGGVRPALLQLLGGVAFVLLIACANVAGLLVARGADRRGELAVRGALGGSRSRLVRQLLTESLVLAAAGGLVGLLLAWLALALVPALAPADLPRLDAVRIDARVAFGTALLTVAVALLFGTAPALRASRSELTGSLRLARTHGRGDRLRRLLVVGEVALALVLLTGAALLSRSFLRLVDNELGFEPHNRATLQAFIWDMNPTDEQRVQFVGAVLERMRALPEVLAAGVTTALPLHPHAIVMHAASRAETEPPPPPGSERMVRTTATSDGYFDAMGMRLLEGRAFSRTDDARAAPVAMISESLARALFPGGSAVGRRLYLGTDRPVLREIIGVVADVRASGFDSPQAAEAYVPHAQTGSGSVTFVVHTRRDPAPVMASLRRSIWDLQPRQTIYYEATLERLTADSVAGRRFHLALLGSFAVIALALAALGVYALLSYATRLRTGEIGVRMAFGARRGQIERMVVGEGLRLALAGVALGLLGSLALTRLLEGMLYGVQATDPLTYAQVAAAMLVVAAAAAFLPARRAARLDPASTLRAD